MRLAGLPELHQAAMSNTVVGTDESCRQLWVVPLTEHYLARSRVAFLLTEAYALKAPALTGVFYCFNRLANPFDQPSILGTKYCSNLLIKPFVISGTSPDH